MTFLAIWQKNIYFCCVSNIHIDEGIKASRSMFIKATTAPQKTPKCLDPQTKHQLELQINVFC